MAESDNKLLTQCLCMVHELVTSNQNITINVKVGNFDFSFSNQKQELVQHRKKLSPSQVMRNQIRHFKHLNKLMGNDRNVSTEDNTFTGEDSSAVKKEHIDNFTQTESCVTQKDEIHNFAQTENIVLQDIATNTEVVTYEDS